MKRQIALIALLLFVTSCSLFTGDPDEARKAAAARKEAAMSEEGFESNPQLSTVPVEELPGEDGTSTTLDKVEVLWKIPEEAADGFIMHYGFAPDALTYNLRLKVEDIEEYQDPQYGAVYRYVIADIPQQKTVFISLQTIRQGVASDPSEVFEVAP